mmetsp:Transcript_49730/g.129027  ORF Transcript_49730/g.129027 Transcript_49730/m.129027 type:complete len:201 (-) Transcript_49730:418-1020(-)
MRISSAIRWETGTLETWRLRLGPSQRRVHARRSPSRAPRGRGAPSSTSSRTPRPARKARDTAHGAMSRTGCQATGSRWHSASPRPGTTPRPSPWTLCSCRGTAPRARSSPARPTRRSRAARRSRDGRMDRAAGPTTGSTARAPTAPAGAGAGASVSSTRPSPRSSRSRGTRSRRPCTGTSSWRPGRPRREPARSRPCTTH